MFTPTPKTTIPHFNIRKNPLEITKSPHFDSTCDNPHTSNDRSNNFRTSKFEIERQLALLAISERGTCCVHYGRASGASHYLVSGAAPTDIDRGCAPLGAPDSPAGGAPPLSTRPYPHRAPRGLLITKDGKFLAFGYLLCRMAFGFYMNFFYFLEVSVFRKFRFRWWSLLIDLL